MSWNSIIGQERAKKNLVSILEQKRLGHAYLFVGPDGVGKDAVAFELAKLVNCLKKKMEACDDCAACHQANQLQHPNIHPIFALPVGKSETDEDSPISKLTQDGIEAIREQIQLKSGNLYYDIAMPRANIIKVNSIRELRRISALTTFGEGVKVFILLDADKMNESSANALLKTLEEPLPNTLIILTSSHPDQLRATIISRCQVVRFEYLQEEEIASALQEWKGVNPAEAQSIARMANGSYARALEMLQGDFLELRKQSVELLRTMLYKSREVLFKQVDEINSTLEKQDVEKMLSLMLSWLRDTLAIREGEKNVVNIDDITALKKFSEAYPEVNYEEIFKSVERAISLLYKNVYIPLILLNLSIGLRKIILPSYQRLSA